MYHLLGDFIFVLFSQICFEIFNAMNENSAIVDVVGGLKVKLWGRCAVPEDMGAGAKHDTDQRKVVNVYFWRKLRKYKSDKNTTTNLILWGGGGGSNTNTGKKEPLSACLLLS